MVLGAIGPCSSKLTLEHAQLVHLFDVELLPAMRRSASAFAADLEAEQ